MPNFISLKRFIFKDNEPYGMAATPHTANYIVRLLREFPATLLMEEQPDDRYDVTDDCVITHLQSEATVAIINDLLDAHIVNRLLNRDKPE